VAYLTGIVDQELILRNECVAAEIRILRGPVGEMPEVFDGKMVSSRRSKPSREVCWKQPGCSTYGGAHAYGRGEQVVCYDDANNGREHHASHRRDGLSYIGSVTADPGAVAHGSEVSEKVVRSGAVAPIDKLTETVGSVSRCPGTWKPTLTQ
jgi:hypothetical protein